MSTGLIRFAYLAAAATIVGGTGLYVLFGRFGLGVAALAFAAYLLAGG